MSAITARPLTAVPLTARPLTAYALGASTDGATAFTPASLFTNNEKGGWWDPSDFSTMFQDAAGTTPVTAVEQPVGLIRDKSGRNNHRSQATTTKRPVLSARVNRLTYSEEFDNAVWDKLNVVTITPNATTDPFGGTNADAMYETAVSNNHFVRSASIVVVAGATITLSVYAKKGTRDYIMISDNNNKNAYFNVADGTVGTVSSGYTAAILSVGNGWYRCSMTGPASVSNIQTYVQIKQADNQSSYLGSVTDFNYYFGAQLEYGDLGDYQRIAAATDYDTVGFPYYLKYDGVDDFMSTAATDFSATDAMTAFMGVQKVSDAARDVLFELGTDTSSVNASFALTAPSADAATGYGGVSRGTATASVATSGTAAPHTAVLTLQSDISADSLSLTVNEAAAVTAATDQGTGNYGNLPIYFGARAGTSLFFPANEYQTIILGREATEAEIAKAQTYVNNKTGAY